MKGKALLYRAEKLIAFTQFHRCSNISYTFQMGPTLNRKGRSLGPTDARFLTGCPCLRLPKYLRNKRFFWNWLHIIGGYSSFEPLT